MNTQKTFTNLWLARNDLPARNVSRASFLIDGRLTMLEMCVHFMRAQRSIYITAWGLTPELLLVRGSHNRSGPPGSPEQEGLLKWLRGKGLSEDDLRFWQECEEKSVANVLGYAFRKGVDVRILLWDTYTLPFQRTPKQTQEILGEHGITCLLDDSHKGLFNQPALAHHQKTMVIDSLYAFVGGIDMMVEGTDYDRWDTKGHPFLSPLRQSSDGKTPHGWHDVHTLFQGPAVADVERNFRERWNDVVTLHKQDQKLLLSEPASPPRAETATPIKPGRSTLFQVTRTIPKGLYDFTPEEGISTILDAYLRAIAQAQNFIYIENQYLWRRAYLGVENPVFGTLHEDMEHLLQALGHALERGVRVAILLPDHPNVGREFTDEGLKYLEELAPAAVQAGYLHAYTLGCSHVDEQQALYRSIYVHAKVAIIDDTWITLGSANLNNRGMRDDTEMNVSVLRPELAHALRILLMAEHLGICDEDDLFRIISAMAEAGQQGDASEEGSLRTLRRFFDARIRPWLRPNAARRPSLYEAHMTGELGELWLKLQTSLGDPRSGLELYTRQASKNFEAIKEHQMLIGHLLPYIPAIRCEEYGVTMDPVTGWIDLLSEA